MLTIQAGGPEFHLSLYIVQNNNKTLLLWNVSIFPALGNKGRVMLGFSGQVIRSARALVSKDEIGNVEENTWH